MWLYVQKLTAPINNNKNVSIRLSLYLDGIQLSRVLISLLAL